MFRVNNNEFKILIKYKNYLNKLDDLIENIPRKDFYYKDKIKEVGNNTLNYILISNYETDKKIINKYYSLIKANIAHMDFMLERFLDKNYVNEKALNNIGGDLIEINKMVTRWLTNINESKN